MSYVSCIGRRTLAPPGKPQGRKRRVLVCWGRCPCKKKKRHHRSLVLSSSTQRSHVKTQQEETSASQGGRSLLGANPTAAVVSDPQSPEPGENGRLSIKPRSPSRRPELAASLLQCVSLGTGSVTQVCTRPKHQDSSVDAAGCRGSPVSCIQTFSGNVCGACRGVSSTFWR